MEKYFPRSTTAVVRAVAAIVIVFCHLTRTMKVTAVNPLLVFGQYATLAVGIFFFYTGYNLIAAYVCRGGEWKKGFWRKKLLGIYLPFVICNVFYQFYYWALKIGPYDLPRIVYFALGGYLMNPDAWYIQSCMIVYFLTYAALFAADILRKDRKLPGAALAALSIAVLAIYSLIYAARGTYISSESVLPLSLTAGMLAASFGERLLCFWKKHKWAAAVLLFFLYGYINYSRLYGAPPIMLLKVNLFEALPVLLEVLIVNSLIIGEEISSRFLEPVSRYSLYMYLTHSLFYQLFRSELIYIKNDILYLLVYLACVCAASFLLGKVIEAVTRGGKKEARL